MHLYLIKVDFNIKIDVKKIQRPSPGLYTGPMDSDSGNNNTLKCMTTKWMCIQHHLKDTFRSVFTLHMLNNSVRKCSWSLNEITLIQLIHH